MDLSTQTNSVLKDLEAALLCGDLHHRAAQSFEALAEKLRRPVRASVLGIEARPRRALLSTILGQELLPIDADWPTVEFVYAERPATHAILPDGITVKADGLPEPELLTCDPALLRIEAPIEVLRRITFLYLSAGPDMAEQSAALKWASKRTDMSIWCTRRYAEREAKIWQQAPDDLKNHAFLVVLGTQERTQEIRRRLTEDYDAVITLPRRDASALIRQIEGDIDAALREDVDVARALIQRFAPDQLGQGDTSIPSKTAEKGTGFSTKHRVGLLSEPLLYLRRRARAAFQMLEWKEREEASDHSDILEFCCDTANGLRDRAAGWPDVEDDIEALKQFVDGASDMAVLMQIEGGPDQAIDAARLIFQLRTALERALFAPKSSETMGMSQ